MKRTFLMVAMAVMVMMVASVGVCAADRPLQGDGSAEGHIPYMEGYPDNTFKPDRAMTRAEFCQVIYNLLAEKPAGYEVHSFKFGDVKAGDWFVPAVLSMVELKAVTGYPNGTFGPNKTITRAEVVAILTRLCKLTTGGTSNFKDVPQSHWAAKEIGIAVGKGWVKGYPDNTFKPAKAVTRAEAATILNAVTERDLSYWKNGIADGSVKFNTDEFFKDVPKDHWAYYNIIEATQQVSPTGDNEPYPVFIQKRGTAAAWPSLDPNVVNAPDYIWQYTDILKEGDPVVLYRHDMWIDCRITLSTDGSEIPGSEIQWDPTNPTVYKAGENVFKYTWNGKQYEGVINAVEDFGVSVDTSDPKVDLYDEEIEAGTGLSWAYGALHQLKDYYAITLNVGDSINIKDLLKGENCTIDYIDSEGFGAGTAAASWEAMAKKIGGWPWRYDEVTKILSFYEFPGENWADFGDSSAFYFHVYVTAADGRKVQLMVCIRVILPER